ncbi:hypothetical protein F02E060_0306 [Escherichia coli]|nr:hypothetical protein F02E060_0306 [Escherichia coli]
MYRNNTRRSFRFSLCDFKTQHTFDLFHIVYCETCYLIDPHTCISTDKTQSHHFFVFC